MIDQRLLLNDGVIAVFDVRCHGAPAAASREEVVEATEVNIPLAGLFVRAVRRVGGAGAGRTAIGDPGRVMVFRRDQPYRVSHPVPGDDRTLVIALRRPPRDIAMAGPEDRFLGSWATLAARRLASDLANGRADALAGAERASALLAGIGLELDRGAAAPADRDRRLAARVRLEVANRLGDRLTLPELGRGLGLSGWELARRFRRATGTSIHAYRTGLRVHAVLERVEGGERDLTGLALDLGFADHSHMTNVVRRATGAPPSAWRSADAAFAAGAAALGPAGPSRERTNLQA